MVHCKICSYLPLLLSTQEVERENVRNSAGKETERVFEVLFRKFEVLSYQRGLERLMYIETELNVC